MPDSPVDHSLTSEAAARASVGSILHSSNFFFRFFFGSLFLIIIHERIQRYIIACNELSPTVFASDSTTHCRFRGDMGSDA